MKNKNIVTIGGGTGSFTLLSGLKKYPIDIAAIVSMADDGGSTGVLRDELGVLPPGDVRQCLVALSDSSDILRKLMNYRFEKGGLAGHNFGNLLLSALEKINNSFSKGVDEAAKILSVKGHVIPVSNEDMRLCIKLKNKKVLNGENNLDHNKEIDAAGIDHIFLKNKVSANPDAIKAIKKADFIVIGPGDLYGSILPNLLVDGISEAIKKSKAKVIYNCNLTNKNGQTSAFDVDDYVELINKYIGKDRINFVTYNTGKPTEKLFEKYSKVEGRNFIVQFNIDKNSKRKFKLIKSDFISNHELPGYQKARVSVRSKSYIRHDSEKLAKLIVMIFELGEYENITKEII